MHQETLDHVEELLEGLITIPTIPSTLMKINKILENPDSSPKDAAEVVSKDPAVATKVLRLVNSAYYALKNPVNSIPFAVSILGLKVLKNLVVQATVLNVFGDTDGAGGLSGEWLWDHSFKAAVAAHSIAKAAKETVKMIPEDAYTCGLIHDVGRIIMAENLGAKYARVILEAKRKNLPLWKREREVFKFDHAHVGAYLADKWGLSPRLKWAVLFHHEPAILAKEGNEGDENLGYLISLSNILAHQYCCDKSPYPFEANMEKALEIIELEEEKLEEIKEKVKETRREG